METNLELYEYIKENFIDDTFFDYDLSVHGAPIGEGSNRIKSEEELALKSFKKILKYSPHNSPDDSKLNKESFYKIHHTIFQEYVEPIVNDIYKNNIDHTIFNDFLLALGIDFEGPQVDISTLVNIWLKSENWGKTLDQDAFEKPLGEARREDKERTYKTSDIHPDDAKKLWTRSNDAIAQCIKYLLVRIDTKHSSLINRPYFLIYIGYEVFISLLFKLEKESCLTSNNDARRFIYHLSAMDKFISERENSSGDMDNKVFNSKSLEASSVDVSKIKNTIQNFLVKENSTIIWVSVFSKHIHIINKKSEDPKTNDEGIRKSNSDRITTILNKFNKEQRENEVTILIRNGLNQFNKYADCAEKPLLGANASGKGDSDKIFYMWGREFFELVTGSIEESTENDYKLIKYFILSNLHSQQTKDKIKGLETNRPFLRQKLENLHNACIHMQVTPYNEIYTMVEIDEVHGESRDIISKHWEVKYD